MYDVMVFSGLDSFYEARKDLEDNGFTILNGYVNRKFRGFHVSGDEPLEKYFSNIYRIDSNTYIW